MLPALDTMKEYLGLLFAFPDMVDIHRGAVNKVKDCDKMKEECRIDVRPLLLVQEDFWIASTSGFVLWPAHVYLSLIEVTKARGIGPKTKLQTLSHYLVPWASVFDIMVVHGHIQFSSPVHTLHTQMTPAITMQFSVAAH
jgi:hypothetical protein